jgi:hypothetical protein
MGGLIVIVFANDEIRRFVEWISDKDISPVELYVVPGYDALEVCDAEHDETVAFGAYDPENKRIIVPEGITDEDKERVLSTIAHEYFHHVERENGLEPNEESAERYAANMVHDFYACKEG